MKQQRDRSSRPRGLGEQSREDRLEAHFTRAESARDAERVDDEAQGKRDEGRGQFQVQIERAGPYDLWGEALQA